MYNLPAVKSFVGNEKNNRFAVIWTTHRSHWCALSTSRVTRLYRGRRGHATVHVNVLFNAANINRTPTDRIMFLRISYRGECAVRQLCHRRSLRSLFRGGLCARRYDALRVRSRRYAAVPPFAGTARPP
jgi:hypothetical protein